MRRDAHGVRHDQPGHDVRADTRRLSSLDEEDGEQEVLRDGRDGQRNEGAPLLERRRLRHHDERNGGRYERDDEA